MTDSAVFHDSVTDDYRDATGPLTISGGGGPPTGSAGGALDGTYPNPGLNATVAGAGLAETSDVLSVNVDGSTIEISSDSLRVKDGGITAAKVAADVATQAELDAHTADTTDAHDASAISVADSGGYFTATDVEAALAEIGAGTVGTSFGVETPSGTVNGVNTAFTLSATPAPAADLLVFKNGMLMKQTLDYTLSGATVTFDSSQIPQTGDVLLAAIPTTAGAGGGVPEDGWIDDTGDIWTYASSDAPTFTFTVSGDKTAALSPGKRIKLTQTTVKYFIVTASAHAAGTTTVTIYGGTDYTLANAAISDNYHSPVKAPDGFPLDPAKWTVETTFSNVPAKASPTANTWYGDTGLSPTGPNISVPIGAWRLCYKTTIASRRAAAGAVFVRCTLSTASNSESDAELTGGDLGVSSNTGTDQGVYAEQQVTLAAKTTYYLNIMTTASSQTSIFLNSQTQSGMWIRAICAYL